MTVRARIYVSEITRYASQPNQAIVKMKPVSRGAGNATWSKWTPSGDLSLNILNPAAVKQFEAAMDEKREFFVDFHLDAPAPVDGDGHAFVPWTDDNNYVVCELCGVKEEQHAAA